MAPGDVLVDAVSDIRREAVPRGRARDTAAPEGSLRVRFAGGAAGRLDLAKSRDRVWADVLRSLRESNEPAYVEIDPDTRYITSLLLPQRFLVTAIRPTGADDIEVELEISHARHYLRHGTAGFERMREALELARREKTPVLVTESLDSTAIIDVRPAAGARRRRNR